MLFCGPSVPERAAAKSVARIAEGLFCLEDRWLLLLAHQPRADGGNQWLVYPVDPIADGLGEAIELPTRAAEIVFVAGQKRWAVLEKGPMRQVGDQPLTRVMTFPRPELTFPHRYSQRSAAHPAELPAVSRLPEAYGFASDSQGVFW
jgi:hypothetical protein